MNQRPIGVFDSGLGGLTAVRQLRRLMPSENIIYFGDTARVPYGNRGRETLLKYARQDLRFLRSFDLKAVVIACGTVSANCLEELRRESAAPVTGVVEPAVERAAAATRSGKVGLIATRASVGSGAYERAFRRLDPALEVRALACPLFVPLVEEGRCRPGDVVIETVAREYLAPLRETGVDTLVLGCTHYPLLREVIGAVMGPDVTLIDVGQEAANLPGPAGGGGRPGGPSGGLGPVLYQRPGGEFPAAGLPVPGRGGRGRGGTGGHFSILMMMEKEIILFVRGEQTYDSDSPEVTELATEGRMTMDNGEITLTYQESELTGMEGTTTRFTIRGDTVTLERTGMVVSRMEFKQGERSSSLYETPWGTMVVDVATTRLAHRLTERGGVLEIAFTIAVNHQVTGENRFKIRVKEMTR